MACPVFYTPVTYEISPENIQAGEAKLAMRAIVTPNGGYWSGASSGLRCYNASAPQHGCRVARAAHTFIGLLWSLVIVTVIKSE